MAHLLSILETDNVFVCCTRWFGGVHLQVSLRPSFYHNFAVLIEMTLCRGPDRFKHINSATRNTLEAGGFLKASQTSNQTTASGKAKNGKHQSKR